MIDSPEVQISRTRKPKKERALQGIPYPFLVRRDINNNSLFEFLKYFWPEVSVDEFQSNWHIEYMCEELEKIAYRVAAGLPTEYDFYIFNVPPGSTKTITCSITFPAWCWTKWYWMRFITGSYSDRAALEPAELSRDLIRSEKFQAIYPDLEIKEDKDAKSNFKIVKKEYIYPGQLPRIHHGGNRFSTSVKGTATSFHGHILIMDDPLNPEQAVSEKELETANRFISQTLSTRKTNKNITPIIIIMQRLHQDDPSGHLLEKIKTKKLRIKHICIPGEIRNYREQVKPQELISKYKDELLDPTRMSWKVLEGMEAILGQYGYAGQVGQDPTPPGGGMFKVDHFNVIHTLPNPVNFLRTVRYWDKAGSEGKGAFTAGVKISQLTDKRWIIEDVKRGQWASEERERIIREVAEIDGPDVVVYIEQEGGSGGKESAEGTIRNLAGFACYADHPTGDKVFRADPYSVQVNNGNVMLLQGDWNHVFVEEHRFFPFSTYKDQVDAAAGAFNHLTEKRLVRRIT